MSPNDVPSKSISRRGFLRAGCVTIAAAGMAACGLSAALPDPSLVEFPSFAYGGETVNNSLLVTYASATGSTVEVAATIGETLGAQGISAQVVPVAENPLLNGKNDYRAVLIGSAVQYGTWLPEAVEFVRANQAALREVPVALFSVHIQNLGDDAPSHRKRLAYLDEVRPLVRPVSEAYFAGRFSRQGAALMLPGLVARFVPTLDFRKWDKIRAWAESVGPRLA